MFLRKLSIQSWPTWVITMSIHIASSCWFCWPWNDTRNWRSWQCAAPLLEDKGVIFGGQWPPVWVYCHMLSWLPSVSVLVRFMKLTGEWVGVPNRPTTPHHTTDGRTSWVSDKWQFIAGGGSVDCVRCVSFKISLHAPIPRVVALRIIIKTTPIASPYMCRHRTQLNTLNPRRRWVGRRERTATTNHIVLGQNFPCHSVSTHIPTKDGPNQTDGRKYPSSPPQNKSYLLRALAWINSWI